MFVLVITIWLIFNYMIGIQPGQGKGKPFKTVYCTAFLLLISVIMTGCSTSERKPDLDGIDARIEIMRLEKDLFAMDIDSIPDQLPEIEDKYDEFFEIFNHLIIRTGSPRSPVYNEQLLRFITDYDIYRLYKEVERVFPDLDNLEEELENAFRYFIYYFPDHQVPQVYTYISGFNQSVVTAEEILAIGLDKYLGSDNEFYFKLQLPNYQKMNMHPAKISSDCMIAWVMTEYEFNDNDDNLLSHMIYHGKLLYIADMLLPDQHDTLKAGFSLSQLEWCIENESRMWTYLVENKLLFSTDSRTISRFINEGPFTREFSVESPGRAAVWLGWQIVDTYMKRHNHISARELMLDTDYQGILNSARYRPR